MGETMVEQSLYDQAVLRVTETRKVSTLFLQSTLAIGYSQASQIIEKMENEGIVSSTDSHGRRQVLATRPRLVQLEKSADILAFPTPQEEKPDYLRIALILFISVFAVTMAVLSVQAFIDQNTAPPPNASHSIHRAPQAIDLC
jgi:hypothetical protein